MRQYFFKTTVMIPVSVEFSFDAISDAEAFELLKSFKDDPLSFEEGWEKIQDSLDSKLAEMKFREYLYKAIADEEHCSDSFSKTCAR